MESCFRLPLGGLRLCTRGKKVVETESREELLKTFLFENGFSPAFACHSYVCGVSVVFIV